VRFDPTKLFKLGVVLALLTLACATAALAAPPTHASPAAVAHRPGTECDDEFADEEVPDEDTELSEDEEPPPLRASPPAGSRRFGPRVSGLGSTKIEAAG
jgi:hypothetical protein